MRKREPSSGEEFRLKQFYLEKVIFMKTALELAFRRDDIRKRLDNLAAATNSWYGKGSSIFDVISSLQKELREIEEELKQR